jgi:hypothetical protein
MVEMKQWMKFSELLIRRLAQGLPGEHTQLLMAPAHRKNDIIKGLHDPGAIKSSVLILIFPHEGLLRTVVMRRPSYNGVHSGQISLPGGKWEATDEDMEATALPRFMCWVLYHLCISPRAIILFFLI